MMKKCRNCKKEKPLEFFPIKSASKDGYNAQCKKCVNDKYNKWYSDNKEKKKASVVSWYNKNRDKVISQKKEYYKNNRKDIINKNIAYKEHKRKTSPFHKFKFNLRKRTNQAFKVNYWVKNGTTESLLGSDYESVKKHIEKQFTKGMNWENYGKWHIDHIIPLCSAENESELKKLCHYTNLQPLWAEDNLSKGGKY